MNNLFDISIIIIILCYSCEYCYIPRLENYYYNIQLNNIKNMYTIHEITVLYLLLILHRQNIIIIIVTNNTRSSCINLNKQSFYINCEKTQYHGLHVMNTVVHKNFKDDKKLQYCKMSCTRQTSREILSKRYVTLK